MSRVRFPVEGLKYPKSTEKPPFMSFAEVEERTKGMSERMRPNCGRRLSHRRGLESLLKHVENNPLPFVYPMFFSRPTPGRRRSEIMRAAGYRTST